MDRINNMNIEEFGRMIRDRNIPYIPLKKKRLNNKPFLIRTTTGSFNTTEQKIFHLYCNRELLQYYNFNELFDKQ